MTFCAQRVTQKRSAIFPARVGRSDAFDVLGQNMAASVSHRHQLLSIARAQAAHPGERGCLTAPSNWQRRTSDRAHQRPPVCDLPLGAQAGAARIFDKKQPPPAAHLRPLHRWA